jgi:hypothetical protein
MNIALGVLLAGLAVVAVLRWRDFGQTAVVAAVLALLLMPLRKDPRAFWSLLAGLIVLLAAYVVSAPANCRTGAYSRVSGTQTEGRFCDSLIGVDYEREGPDDPSALPAFAASLAAGLLAAGVVRIALRRLGPDPAADPLGDADDEAVPE